MELDKYKSHPAAHGVISTVFAVAITFGVHQVFASGDIQWTLIAVAIASFFSGTFSAYYSDEE